MDGSFRAAMRCLADFGPDLPVGGSEGSTLEMSGAFVTEPARIASSQVIEGHALRAIRISGDPETGYQGFLDGTQRSRVVGYADSVPIVHATVAAVIRVRVNRRLFTWPDGALVRRAVLAPRRALPAALWKLLEERFESVIDTGNADGDLSPADAHPFGLVERAVHAVQELREALEERLAIEWCRRDGRPLVLDGGIKRSETVARSRCAVGIVKSHRTLYVEGDALARVLHLRRGERSSVFRVTRAPGNRAPVASWYLRLRDHAGHDPLWGLVRVEAADPQALGESLEETTARADRLSRWILAEVTPLALPDARWDKMIYPIRDCEEYLRAVG